MKLVIENGTSVTVKTTVRFNDVFVQADRFHPNGTRGGVCKASQHHNGNVELATVLALQELCLNYNVPNRFHWTSLDLKP